MGNCVNALLVSWLAAESGTVVLRIDDVDQSRYRAIFADDIFRTLRWLDVHIDEGPKSTHDLETVFSQRHRRPRYLDVAIQALDLGLARACSCSRLAVECPCSESLAWQPGVNALRLRVAGDHPGPVLWRRDNVPAYHLTSIVDDHDLEITHVIRGDDLHESTQIQRGIATALFLTFPADVRHHTLVLDERGAKLSKSTGGRGALPHNIELRTRVTTLADHIGASIGIVSAHG